MEGLIGLGKAYLTFKIIMAGIGLLGAIAYIIIAIKTMLEKMKRVYYRARDGDNENVQRDIKQN